jgi:hypothetical protein
MRLQCSSRHYHTRFNGNRPSERRRSESRACQHKPFWPCQMLTFDAHSIHPAITFIQQLDEPTLLSSLTSELKQQLQQFIGAVKLDVSRMTRDH